jgi:hypothetical protein
MPIKCDINLRFLFWKLFKIIFVLIVLIYSVFRLSVSSLQIYVSHLHHNAIVLLPQLNFEGTRRFNACLRTQLLEAM